MKKILGIFAASAAALGSAMIAAPVHAQSAILPVEVQITPAIFLRTYSDLKFIVSQQDLQGGRSVDQDAGSYDERAGITPLSTETPTGSENLTVTKTVPVLYQIWGGSTNPDVEVTASKDTLTGPGSTGIGGGSSTPVRMTVIEGDIESATNGTGTNYKQASAGFEFTFPTSNIAQGTTFTGGEVTIRIVNP
ncbi:MAG: hypothetical protein IGS23_10600 [Rivularia sp. T60_A2020_040]|nr:hypothetical protein [Rivularia sp. T60_A2020_040]